MDHLNSDSMNNPFGMNIIPENDSQRIAALESYKIMDTAPESLFDDITRLATQIFNVPIALISFVGASQVFLKSSVGIDQTRYLPREVSPCSLAILKETTTVFPNAKLEPCLSANTLVTSDPGMMFYAGAPLICPEGFCLGTICLIANTPRDFTAADEIILQGLSRIVMDAISLRQTSLIEGEQLQARKQTELSEQRLKNMIMAAPMGMAVLQSRDLIVEIANKPILDFWNRTVEDVMGKPLLEALPELTSQPFPAMLQEIFDTAKPLAMSEIAVYVATDEGLRRRYADFTYNPLFDLHGNVESIMVTIIDITEVVEARKLLTRINEEMADTQDTLKIIIAELANSEARFRGVFERAPLGMALLSGEKLVIEFANDYMLRFWEKGPEIIGMPRQDALPELIGQPFVDLIHNVYATGIAYKGHEQKAITIHNGKPKEGFYNFVYEPLRDEHGITTNILIIADDVTEKVYTRKQANRISEMLNMAVDSAELGTWFFDVETREFVPSAKVKALFGYEPDADLPYRKAISHISPEYQEQVVSAIGTALKNGESYDLEFPVQHPLDQPVRWLRATGNLYRPEPDMPSYYSGILMDVTARKLDDQRKNDFIAMVSHELKTPLTSLKAYIQILNSKAQHNQDLYAVGALNKAETQINKMNTLIKSFLDVARLEAGKINLNIEPFDLTALISEVIAEATDIVQSHELIFEPCPMLMVCADKDKIAQVVTNFLSNAVKYSAWGKNIFIRCSQIDDMIQVSVTDEGMGIKVQDMEKLFNRFYRIERPETHTISGFGIGLYLCAEIIQRHHGKIWVDSEVGVGSTFHFRIPVSFHIYE
jgi:signal transduction histidine kinase